MERVIVCPVCKDTDTCFEEIQENFSSYMCFNCGFMSDTRYRAGSVELLDNLNQSPQLVQDLQYNDETKGIVWFPCVINMGELGIIYPDEDSQDKAAFKATDKKNYVWKYDPTNQETCSGGHFLPKSKKLSEAKSDICKMAPDIAKKDPIMSPSQQTTKHIMECRQNRLHID